MSSLELFEASEKGNLESVKRLLASGEIDVNFQGISIQDHSLYFKQSFHRIEMHIDLWNLIKTFNFTPLIVASREGHTEIVRELLAHEGINTNLKDI